MKILVRSALDVALWFNDRAFGDGEYLQPQKLHRLLYLAYGYFSLAYPKQKLMPATFVTDEVGPIEPTVFHALAFGVPPNLEMHGLPKAADEFLESIWQRYGTAKAEHLTRLIANHDPVADAMLKGLGEEITLAQMVAFYGSEIARKKGVPAAAVVEKPKVLKSSMGGVVTVSPWLPKPVTAKK